MTKEREDVTEVEQQTRRMLTDLTDLIEGLHGILSSCRVGTRFDDLRPDHKHHVESTWATLGAWMGRTIKSTEQIGTEEIDHPPRYTQHPSGIECIDIIEPLPTPVATALKHIWRLGLKQNTTEQTDLEKSVWYFDRFNRHVPLQPYSWAHKVGRVIGAAPEMIVSRVLGELVNFFNVDPANEWELKRNMAYNARIKLLAEAAKRGITLK